MTTIAKFVSVLIFGITTLYTQQETTTVTQEIQVTITDIDSDEGMLYIALYNSEETFLGTRYKSAMSRIEKGNVVVRFTNVPEGIYAVSVFHDENNNQKLDTNFMGIPKEDTGCSNNAKGFMGAQKWEDAKFEIKDKAVSLQINM